MTWSEPQLTTYLKVVKALGDFDAIEVWRALGGTKDKSQCRKHCTSSTIPICPPMTCPDTTPAMAMIASRDVARCILRHLYSVAFSGTSTLYL